MDAILRVVTAQGMHGDGIGVHDRGCDSDYVDWIGLPVVVLTIKDSDGSSTQK